MLLFPPLFSVPLLLEGQGGEDCAGLGEHKLVAIAPDEFQVTPRPDVSGIIPHGSPYQNDGHHRPYGDGMRTGKAAGKTAEYFATLSLIWDVLLFHLGSIVEFLL